MSATIEVSGSPNVAHALPWNEGAQDFNGPARCGAIEWQEEIPVFRRDVDGYKVYGQDVNGGWEDGIFFVSVTNRGGFWMEYSRYPGM